MSRFTKIKSDRPEMTQKQKQQQLCYSDSTIKICREEMNMTSPFSRRNRKRKKMGIHELSENSSHVKSGKCECRTFSVSQTFDGTFKNK